MAASSKSANSATGPANSFHAPAVFGPHPAGNGRDLYGLHRLGLYLERRDLIYYWYQKSSGGSAYNPLHEMVHSQVRHVIDVGEQRVSEDEPGGRGDLNSATRSWTQAGPMSLETLQTIPILRIFSVEKAREFYIEFLGFAVDWEHRFDAAAPIYMQVSRAGCVLHLSEHHGDCCPGSTVFVRVTGLEGYHREITSKGYGHLRPGLEPTFHGSRCMEVIDPFGNRIRFDESTKELKA